MKNNRTPGRWKPGTTNTGGAIHISVVSRDEETKAVALCGYINAHDEPESVDNARLIQRTAGCLLAATLLAGCFVLACIAFAQYL